ncbi:MAG TPA: YicC/YloC family endoribonuclease [Alkalispirochaeta sp.]|nr:YicC/YloC family endoribonuclease [Alkalispirochaeta sp.]
MRSMTGYGYAEASNSQRDLSIEIRSLNNRYLEVYTSLPSFLNPIEPEIRKAVGAKAIRGKIEVQIRLREYRNDLEIYVDPNAVEAARTALATIADLAGIDRPPAYRDILEFEGVIQTERRRDPEVYREDILHVLGEALTAWNVTRDAEGDVTHRDIEKHLDRLRAAATVFTESAPRVEQLLLDAVRSRFREVLGDDADEQRVYAEAALLMVKHATNEEIVRLKSHVDSFADLLGQDSGVGKRLDFICQEMNREINTTGSKTVLPEVQDAVVEAKDAVEAIREQIRNIE